MVVLRLFFGLSLLGLVGCSGPEWVFVPFPDTLSTESGALVLSLDDGEAVLSAAAIEESSETGINLRLPTGADGLMDLRLTVLQYLDTRLDVLGLEQGPISADARLSCDVLTPDMVLESESGGPWRTLERLDTAGVVAEFLVDDAANCSCLELVTSRSEVPDAAEWVQLERVDGERAIGVTDSETAWFIDSAGVERAPTPLRVVRGVAVRGEDDFWFGTTEGEIYRGPVSGPYTLVRSGTTTETVKTLETSPADQPLEVFAGFFEDVGPNTELQRVERFDGERWETIFEERVDETGQPKLDLVWFGPGSVAFTIGSQEVIFYERGQIRRVNVASFAGSPLSVFDVQSLVRTSERQWLAGGHTGKIFRSLDDGLTWMELESEKNFAAIREIVPLDADDGFLVVEQSGVLTQLRPPADFCRGVSLDWNLYVAVRTDRYVLVGGERSPGGVLPYFRVETNRKAPIK